MNGKHFIGTKNGLAIYVSDTAIAQFGFDYVRDKLCLTKRWPVKTDLSGNIVMAHGTTHEDAVQRYLSRTE